jgi:hypothetical protein
MSEEQKTTFTEEIKVTGANLVEEVKRLIHEGNVNHIVIKDEAGATVTEIPLNVGIIGIALLPVLAAIAAIVVLATNYTIVVHRVAP